MGREETEQKLLELVRQIRAIYREYAGNARYLEVLIKKGNIHIYNEYWERDSDTPVKADERVEE